MSAETAAWPVKTRDLHNHHMDSTVWDDFRFRADDIIIATYGKSGTTWTQQIIAQMIFGGKEDVNVADLSPWLDLRIPPKEVKLHALEAQDHRRFIKTHLPVDALVFSQKAKYLYIGRDGRDIVWSLYNHHARANAEWYAALNDTPGRVGPPIDPPPESPATYFRQWLAQDGFPFWPFWDNVRSWWEIRALPNVLLMHFNEMKADLPAAVDRIADFLDIDLDEETRSKVIAHSSFDHMKRHADRVAPLGGAMWEGGAQTFIHRGTNERWRDALTGEDIAAYDTKARAELGEACAHWLASGQRLD